MRPKERGEHMPDIKLPIDERFTIKFKANGGKFLYCENLDEIFENFTFIIKENNWENKKILLFDKNLKKRFESPFLKLTTKVSEATYFFTTCENLIGNDGSILISSNQIFEKKT